MIRDIYLELTSVCNYRCRYCPHPTMQRDKTHMPVELARAALDQIEAAGIGRRVVLNYLGEPLAYPHLFDIVEYAAAIGLTTQIITNGSLLNARIIERIRASSLSCVKVSYETPDDQTFALRGSPTFEAAEILDNLLALIDATKGGRLRIVIIYMMTLPGQPRAIDGISLLSSLEALREELRAMTTRIARLVPVRRFLDIDAELGRLDLHGWNPYLSINDQVLVEVRPTLDWGHQLSRRPVAAADRGRCDAALKNELGILVNGDVVCCCVDPEGETRIGNIRDASLQELLEAERAIAIRRNFDNGIVTLERCRICLGTALPENVVPVDRLPRRVRLTTTE